MLQSLLLHDMQSFHHRMCTFSHTHLCCSVCVAVCCSMRKYVAVTPSTSHAIIPPSHVYLLTHPRVLQCVCCSVCCSTLQYIAVRCSHSVFMPGKYLVRRGGQNKNKNKNKNGMASVGDSNVCYMTCKYSISSVCKKINLRSQDTLEIESFVHKVFFGCLTPKETHIYRKF